MDQNDEWGLFTRVNFTGQPKQPVLQRRVIFAVDQLMIGLGIVEPGDITVADIFHHAFIPGNRLACREGRQQYQACGGGG